MPLDQVSVDSSCGDTNTVDSSSRASMATEPELEKASGDSSSTNGDNCDDHPDINNNGDSSVYSLTPVSSPSRSEARSPTFSIASSDNETPLSRFRRDTDVIPVSSRPLPGMPGLPSDDDSSQVGSPASVGSLLEQRSDFLDNSLLISYSTCSVTDRIDYEIEVSRRIAGGGEQYLGQQQQQQTIVESASAAVQPSPKEDEKKEVETPPKPPPSPPNNRKARLAKNTQQQSQQPHDEIDPRYNSSIKFTESDVASVDGLPFNLLSQLQESKNPMTNDARDKMLQRLDAYETPTRKIPLSPRSPERPSPARLAASPESERRRKEQQASANSTSSTNNNINPDASPAAQFMDAANNALNYLLGVTTDSCQQVDDQGRHRGRWDHNAEEAFALLGCAPVLRPGREERVPAMPTSLIRVTSEPPPPSFAETVHNREVDPRLKGWVDGQFVAPGKPPKDGSYHLGRSRTVIVHEIVRQSWTWCTAWSPAGDLLAVGTENHHLAVIDTRASTVWRVKHDKKIEGPVKNGTTHSIRSIAWGTQFIAIGGTGNAVSLLWPKEPFPVLHTLRKTGFVGSLSWRLGSNILAIGSRLEKAMVVRIKAVVDPKTPGAHPTITSEVLWEDPFKNWVNCVSFSPGGTWLAVGDAAGTMRVYSYAKGPGKSIELNLVKAFAMKDSVLSIEWSPDGKWLYAGGEDFNVSAIDTEFWEVVHQVHRDRWVQCISSSNSGSHVAVGGVSSEISILDVEKGWESVMGIELKGVVPLSAKWHPKDQYLTVTGQNNSILAVETTNARHVPGHHLNSISPILAIEFSPDGRMAIVGNESGVVTFFSLSGSKFVTAYELVVVLNDKLSIQWSLNGLFVVIGSQDSVIIVRRKRKGRDGKEIPQGASGFSVRKVIRDMGPIRGVSIDPHSQYIAVSGETNTQILDAHDGFAKVQEFKDGACCTNAWSPDGRWLATVGKEKVLTIYDTGHELLERWRPIFSLKCDFVGHALTWAPLIVGGLLYLAYGGDGDEITIMEIRTLEGTWETVLRIPRDGAINGLDWNTDGLLAAAIGNGTVSLVDLSYLQSGVAVNEMDYDWQRQALTCFTEIRRNRGKNAMQSVRWIPSAPGSDSLLAVGGTDGELEIIDLTERRRCRGYVRGLKN